MVELTSYGLTGLTAILAIAFCLAYGDELAPTREKFSYGLINNPHVNDSPLVETGARSLLFRGMSVSNKRLRRRSYCRKHRGLQR